MIWNPWKRIAQLESEKFDLERALFESQQFEQIASGKLAEWVERHDTLLLLFKKVTGNSPQHYDETK